LKRNHLVNRWAAGAACLLLSGSLANAALSTTADATEHSARARVSAGVPSRFPGARVSDAAASTLPRPEVGADAERLREMPEIDALLEKAVRIGRTPGAVVLVGRREGVVFRRAYGHRSIIPERQEMTTDTIFDLASLTKPLVVGTLIQWLVENGRLSVSEPAVKYLPEFGVREKYLVTIEQLLLHTSGLPPTNSLRDYKQGPDRARALTLGGWLYKYPGREFIYSDIGYIALGELIENVTGERLDRTAERVIWKPLGMSDTRYCPSLCQDPRIAPTELNYGWSKNPIRGEPSDTRAYRLGSVVGNAGVFSSVDDLAKFARMLLGGGELGGVRVLSTESVHELMRPRAIPSASCPRSAPSSPRARCAGEGRVAPGQMGLSAFDASSTSGGAPHELRVSPARAVRTLGWDVSSGFSSGRGRALSARAVGHGGYTGTSLWIDPVLDLFVVFLSNRNHPFSTGKVTDLQGQVADAAVRALFPDGPRSAALEPGAALESNAVAIGSMPQEPPRACAQGDAPCTERGFEGREPLHKRGG
jgi:CubicO group peptidase (beta-lactamase class C family)